MGEVTSFQQEALQQAHVDIAVLKTIVEGQAKQIDALILQLREVNTKLGQIETTLSEARGGWRTLMLVGGAGASLGGLLTWFAQHFKP